MLVLQFIPDAARAVAEMRRVVRPGGTVTAAVWVLFGSLHPTRMMWNVAAVVDPSIERPLFRALSAPNEMANQWRELGLLDVEQTCLLIRMEYSGFDDYWLPLTSEGRWHNLSLAYLLRPARRWPSMCRAPISPNLPDGPRSVAASHGPVVGCADVTRATNDEAELKPMVCISRREDHR